MTAGPFLPYGRQVVDDADIAAVVEVLRSPWLTTGPAVAAFEADIMSATGAAHAVVCANGTAALHLAALALGLGPSDTAIVPAITFAATANAVRYTGADVVFADVDPDTGLARAADFEAALAIARKAGRTVRAMFPVHMAGQCERLDEIAAVARRNGLAVVEDASHALGTAYRETRIGDCSYSDMTTFSFHPVKTITTGEGGAVTTRSPELAEKLRLLRSHGIEREPARMHRPELAFDASGAPNPWYYELHELGFNYRICDIQAALGSSQMKKLAAFVAQRARIVACYDRLLSPLVPHLRMMGRVKQVTPSWHLAVALIDFVAIGKSRAELMAWLKKTGVGTQVHYVPVPYQPYYASREFGTAYPGAAAWYDRCLSLPLFPAMSESDAERVAGALIEAIQR